MAPRSLARELAWLLDNYSRGSPANDRAVTAFRTRPRASRYRCDAAFRPDKIHPTRRQRRPPLYWYCVPSQPVAAPPVLNAAMPPVRTYRSEGSILSLSRSDPRGLYSRTSPSVPRSPASRRVLSSHTRPSPSIDTPVGAAASFLLPPNRFFQRRSPFCV